MSRRGKNRAQIKVMNLRGPMEFKKIEEDDRVPLIGKWNDLKMKRMDFSKKKFGPLDCDHEVGVSLTIDKD